MGSVSTCSPMCSSAVSGACAAPVGASALVMVMPFRSFAEPRSATAPRAGGRGAVCGGTIVLHEASRKGRRARPRTGRWSGSPIRRRWGAVRSGVVRSGNWYRGTVRSGPSSPGIRVTPRPTVSANPDPRRSRPRPPHSMTPIAALLARLLEPIAEPRRFAAGVALVFAVGAAGLLAVPPAARAWDSGEYSSASESQLIAMQNQARASAGRKSLKLDTALRKVARWRSKDMVSRDYFSHTIKGTDRKVFWYLQHEYGYCFNWPARTSGP